MQRTKQSTWPVRATEDDKLTSLEIVFDFVRAVYHRHHASAPDYNSDYTACTPQPSLLHGSTGSFVGHASTVQGVLRLGSSWEGQRREGGSGR